MTVNSCSYSSTSSGSNGRTLTAHARIGPEGGRDAGGEAARRTRGPSVAAVVVVVIVVVVVVVQVAGRRRQVRR